MIDRRGVRILIADDHVLFRMGLILALRSLGFDALDEAGDGTEALRMMRRTPYHIALLDLRMPGLDGLKVAEARIGEPRDDPVPHFILLSTYSEPAIGQEAERLGFASVLGKDVEPHQLAELIDGLVAGQPARRITSPDRMPELSARELDVLRGLASGASVRVIADDLGVGTETVKAHVANLYGKLGVRDRVSAVLQGQRFGWLVLDELRAGDRDA